MVLSSLPPLPCRFSYSPSPLSTSAFFMLQDLSQETENTFLKIHESQLRFGFSSLCLQPYSHHSLLSLSSALVSALGIPRALYSRLEYKIQNLIFDASAKFGIEEYETGERNCIVTAEEGIQPFEDIYLIDHAFSFQDAEV
jgi:hypothetical protein